MMPIHDWTRVDAGLFHHFHQHWTVSLCDALNEGCLPSDYFALVEQRVPGPIPDLLTLKLAPDFQSPANGSAGMAVAEAPPRARMVGRTSMPTYAAKANLVTIRHRHGDVVAVIEIVSPGNKASAAELAAFAEKSAAFIRHGVHLLVADLFPPASRDREGIHKAIWDQLVEEQTDVVDEPLGQRRMIASYSAGPEIAAYVETLNVGEVLPDMPVFLRPDFYVPAPLEATYQAAWKLFPRALKGLLEPQ